MAEAQEGRKNKGRKKREKQNGERLWEDEEKAIYNGMRFRNRPE